jgi:hypothetical protein
MRNWEVHDGEREVGPVDEQRVLRMIADGLPATAMVRAVGKDEWRRIRTHAPFAAALDDGRAAEMEVEVEVDPRPHAEPPRSRSASPWAAEPAAAQEELALPLELVNWKRVGRVVAVGTVGVIGMAVLVRVLPTMTQTTTANVEVPAPAPSPRPEAPNPLRVIMTKQTAAEAIEVAAPYLVDKFNEPSPGTAIFVLWALKNMRWQDVGTVGDETSLAKVLKDVAAERTKRLCLRGSIVEIAATPQDSGTAYVGILMTEGMNLVHFYAVKATGELVEQSPARFCGFVTGKYDYPNSIGGTGHAIDVVGMFDLPANRGTK